MGRTRSLLSRSGYWPDAPDAPPPPSELTVAARNLAANTIETLRRDGVEVQLDRDDKVQFRVPKIASRSARLEIERSGDLIQSYLRWEASR
jgi:hypothetical protein